MVSTSSTTAKSLSFVQRLKKAFQVLTTGKDQTEEKVPAAILTTDLASTLSAEMRNIDTKPLQDRVVALQKIVYHLADKIELLTANTKNTNDLLLQYNTLYEEFVNTMEQVLNGQYPQQGTQQKHSALSDEHSQTGDGSPSSSGKKRLLN